MTTRTTYRDCLGTLNVNIKVLSQKLDNVLFPKGSDVIPEMDTLTASIYVLERMAQDMAAEIDQATKRRPIS